MTRLIFLKTITGSLGLAAATFLGLKRGKVAEPEEKTPKAESKGIGRKVYQLESAKETPYTWGIDPANGRDRSVTYRRGWHEAQKEISNQPCNMELPEESSSSIRR